LQDQTVQVLLELAVNRLLAERIAAGG